MDKATENKILAVDPSNGLLTDHEKDDTGIELRPNEGLTKQNPFVAALDEMQADYYVGLSLQGLQNQTTLSGAEKDKETCTGAEGDYVSHKKRPGSVLLAYSDDAAPTFWKQQKLVIGTDEENNHKPSSVSDAGDDKMDIDDPNRRSMESNDSLVNNQNKVGVEISVVDDVNFGQTVTANESGYQTKADVEADLDEDRPGPVLLDYSDDDMPRLLEGEKPGIGMDEVPVDEIIQSSQPKTDDSSVVCWRRTLPNDVERLIAINNNLFGKLTYKKGKKLTESARDERIRRIIEMALNEIPMDGNVDKLLSKIESLIQMLRGNNGEDFMRLLRMIYARHKGKKTGNPFIVISVLKVKSIQPVLLDLIKELQILETKIKNMI